jgi:hypothetical protein
MAYESPFPSYSLTNKHTFSEKFLKPKKLILPPKFYRQTLKEILEIEN